MIVEDMELHSEGDRTVATITKPDVPIKKITYHKIKRNLWQVYFWDKRYKKQIFLQRLPGGEPLRTENDCVTALYLVKDGYDEKIWHKDKFYNFDTAIKDWLKHLNCCEEWSRKKKRMVEKYFIPYFQNKDIRAIKTLHIRQFHSHLKEQGLSDDAIHNLLSELKQFFRFNLKSIGEIPDFPKIQLQAPVIRWLTDDEQDKVFSFLPEEDSRIFGFLRAYGTRMNEAIGLLRENVFEDYFIISSVLDFHGNLRPSTKTKKVKVLPIIPETKWIFEPVDPPAYVDGKQLVFGSNGRAYTNKMLRRRWNIANRQAKVQRINLNNAMRHSFAMQRLNDGFSLGEVSTVLGHSNLQTTVNRYAKYTTEKLAEIIKGKKVHSQLIQISRGKVIEKKGRKWSGREDLNLRHLTPHASALPGCATPR